MARGLPPMAPARRSTRVSAARRSEPSGGINGSCNTGPVQCCNSITYASDAGAKTIISALSLVVPDETAVGLTCQPLTALGIGGNGCQSQPVCCENNDFEGAIVIGCSPININFVR
ncbi:fungal hydrophobin-domain-containing protein [Crepidotus variabilis]|uniref:Hydrophobin n=1 Tax=Crepidotus variabilis TaxID=179855 RepID=A0A9P6E644_9AGAR|nr:fungal hydrophobin-domain-containing protein [Crepidotus variabilis]